MPIYAPTKFQRPNFFIHYISLTSLVRSTSYIAIYIIYVYKYIFTLISTNDYGPLKKQIDLFVDISVNNCILAFISSVFMLTIII